jgi:hypothetical protein
MQPFEQHLVVRSVTADDVVPIPMPARNLTINKIVIKQIGATDNFTADLLNRSVTNPINRILKIVTSSGKCMVKFAVPHRFYIEDRLTLASTGVVGYNTTHAVTRVVDPYTVITDQDYSADASAGTATLILTLVSVVAGSNGCSRFTTLRPCILRVGDLVTVASMVKASDGTAAGDYNTTHYVREVTEYGFEAYTDFTVEALGGTVAITHGSLLDPWRIGAALTAVSGLATSYETYGRAANLLDVRRSAMETPQLHIKLSAAATYHVAIAGLINLPD